MADISKISLPDGTTYNLKDLQYLYIKDDGFVINISKISLPNGTTYNLKYSNDLTDD